MLKNGDRELLKNYRPVSCLAAASKLLEKIVCAQVSEFFEVNIIKYKGQPGCQDPALSEIWPETRIRFQDSPADEGLGQHYQGAE